MPKESKLIAIGLIAQLGFSFAAQAADENDFAIHPVLGTKAGESYSKTLSDSQVKQLFSRSSDLNYFQHEKAERDAANMFCRSLENGHVFKTLDHPYYANCTFGLTAIPLAITFERGKCIRARIACASEFPKNSQLMGTTNAGRIIHPVLDIAAFESYSKPGLTDWQMKQLCKEFSYSDHHMQEAGMFRAAEQQAANLFQHKLVGLTMAAVREKAGAPYATTKMGRIFGDTTDGATTWIYYLGFGGIPVRISFKDGLAQTCFITTDQLDDFRKLCMILFTQEPATQVDKKIAPYYKVENRPRGLTKAAIIELYGEPPRKKRQIDGKEIYWYGFCDNWGGELIFDGDRCIESTLQITFGYRRKENSSY